MIIDNIKYQDIYIDKPEDLPNNEEGIWRVAIPSTFENQRYMEKEGFTLIDRSLEVKVPLGKSKDFEKNIRMEVCLASEGDYDEISRIAHKSFSEDSRFSVMLNEKREYIAESILNKWLNNLHEVYVCKYKETIIGFADISVPDSYKGASFFHLVAIEDKYRLTGGALSLYSYVCKRFMEKGDKSIFGRISTRNTAVMNLYIELGGRFSKPWDIYVKEGIL